MLALAAFSLVSCEFPWVEPVVDPYPYPESYTANKDLAVKPGDSFFDYCNGTWLAAHPIPTDSTQILGGMYDADGVMNERVEQIKNRVPDIGQYFALMDQMYGHAQDARAYIDARKAKITKPESKEEAYRTIGRMYLDGVNVLRITCKAAWETDKMVGIIIPSAAKDFPTSAEDLQRENLKHLDNVLSIPALLAEGMGIDIAMMVTSPKLDTFWNTMWDNTSLDELYQKMQDAWLYYEAYADEDGLAAYNATLSKEDQVTRENLLSSADADLGYTISYYLQQLFIPQSLKDKYLRITKEVQSAFRNRILAVDWMSETTKQNALDKLEHCGLHVAFPDTWHKDCIPALADCKSLAEALHRVKAGNAHLYAALIGTRDLFSYTLMQVEVDSNNESESMDLRLVNALYYYEYNCIMIYPAMLLPPIMPEDGLSEACYYAVFSVIGHELTHGYDHYGSKWNKYGKEQNWWAVADMMAFQDRKENLIRTYSNLELDPVRAPLVFCDGDRTQGENIADLGGFLTALEAYKDRLDEQGFCGKARLEQYRKFYESYAHLWCIQYGDKKFNILKNSDVHSHARLRVNGVVMNTDLWYELYDVNRDNLLYLPKDRRAYIW